MRFRSLAGVMDQPGLLLDTELRPVRAEPGLPDLVCLGVIPLLGDQRREKPAVPFARRNVYAPLVLVCQPRPVTVVVRQLLDE